MTDLLRLPSLGATDSSEEMASRDRARFPLTKILGKSYMTQGMIEDLEKRGVLEAGMARPPPDGEIEAKPQPDKVVVFRDFFIAGLRFPLDPVVVEIFKIFDVYTHQMTSTSFVRLNMYMWLSKTFKLKPTATGFAHLFRCHFQPKTVFVKSSENAEASEADPQFGVYTFAFHTQLPSPVVAYRNRWGCADNDVVLPQGPPRWILADTSSGGERVWIASGAASVRGS